MPRIEANKRYLRMTPTGGTVCWGRRLMDIERVGEGIIVDYKLLRWTNAPYYPPTGYLWHTKHRDEPPFKGLTAMIRANEARLKEGAA
jgi:hypothetical protein